MLALTACTSLEADRAPSLAETAETVETAETAETVEAAGEMAAAALTARAAAATPRAVAAATGYSLEVVGTEVFVSDTRAWPLILVRIHRPDGGRTYVQWIPSDKPGERPLVVSTDPYDGVPWSGEALDARWATYQPDASGMYLDRDGPGFDGAATIVYHHRAPAQIAEEMLPHLWNDFGALVVFGRYYAGGSVRDDIADMAAGMWLASLLPHVDRGRIGVWGGSWGGFEALYAAQQAQPHARPRVVAALYPPIDFAEMVGHFATRTGAARTFLAPYVRRITAATGGLPSQPGADYRGLRTADLCDGLPDDTLVLHDEHDNLVPVAQSQALTATCGASALYWPRTGAPDPSVVDHGPLSYEAAPSSIALYSMTYLHLRLLPPEQPFLLEFYAPSALRDHLRTIHAAQAAGRDISYVLPRINDLADPRVYLIDLAACGANGCPVEPGAVVISRIIDEIWN